MKNYTVIALVVIGALVLIIGMARKALHLSTPSTACVAQTEASWKDGAKDALEFRVAVWNVKETQYLTEVHIPKDLFVAIDAMTPPEFKQETFAEAKPHDPQSAALDQQYVRWVGRLRLRPNDPLVFSIPARTPGKGAGILRFFFQSKDNVPSGSAEAYVRVHRVIPARLKKNRPQ